MEAALAYIRSKPFGASNLVRLTVSPENAAALLNAGADVLVSGSAFFGHKPYDARLAAFMKASEGRAVRPGLRAARAWRHAASNANP